MDHTLLYPGAHGSCVDDSPSSSVFDLPVQPANPSPQPPATQGSGSNNVHLPLGTRVQTTDTTESSPKITVISGGSGGNSICTAFDDACFVLPVSDDGGSSSEIIRVLGGPSIGTLPSFHELFILSDTHLDVQGDIRSRLVRLIPPAPPNSPLGAVRTLLSYRLPANVSEREAREEWRDIIEGRSLLWAGVPNDRKETIRGPSQLLRNAYARVNGMVNFLGTRFSRLF